MEKKIKINIPKGYTIDKEKSTFEEIIFKKVDRKPKSWEEYVNNRIAEKSVGYYISPDSKVSSISWNKCISGNYWKNVLPTKELAEAHIALMQLTSLRQDWIHKWSRDNGMSDDWEPDWKSDNIKFVIIKCKDCEIIEDFYTFSHPLSFPTKEMAIEFLNTFKDLLEIAKPLI